MLQEMDEHYASVLKATMVPSIRGAMHQVIVAVKDIIPDERVRVEFVTSLMLLTITMMSHFRMAAEDKTPDETPNETDG